MKQTPEHYLKTHSPPAPARIPSALAEAAERYRAELDLLHPGWRAPHPACDFGGYEFDDTRARIKWLLKRESLLRQGRDWLVGIAWQGRKPFAHPIDPATITDAARKDQIAALPAGRKGEAGDVPTSPWSEREIDEQIVRNRLDRGPT